MTANPVSIASGGSATLNVTAANATQVTVTGTDGSSYPMQSTGGTQTVSPTTTTTYTATATADGESTSVTVDDNGGTAYSRSTDSEHNGQPDVGSFRKFFYIVRDSYECYAGDSNRNGRQFLSHAINWWHANR